MEAISNKIKQTNFAPKAVLNVCIVYKINLRPKHISADFVLGHYLFGTVIIIWSCYVLINIFVLNLVLEQIHVDFFSMFDGNGIAKNIIIFGAEKKRKILILDKDPTQGLYDTTLTAEAGYSIDFSEQGREFCLCLHYGGSDC